MADLQAQLQPLLQDLSREINNGTNNRLSIVKAAQSLIHAAQDKQQMFFYFCCTKTEIAVLRLYLKWQAFEAIPIDGAISFTELAAKICAGVDLTARLTRFLIANGMLALGPSPDTVTHTHRSRFIASDPLFRSTIQLLTYDEMPQPAAVPEYFEKYGRQHAPKDRLHTPFAFSKNQPEKPVFEVLHQDPETQKLFMQAMTSTQDLCPTPAHYDLSWAFDSSSSSSNTKQLQLVDVGGGAGHTIHDFLTRSNGRLDPSRCVLQDRSEVVAKAQKDCASDPIMSKVQKLPIDFHAESPVRGARAYLLRRVLHDYGDDECVTILRRIRASLLPKDSGKPSKLVIMDLILVSPDETPACCYAVDMGMIGIGGKERTLEDWHSITEQAGLKIEKVVKAQAVELGVLECVIA